MSMDDSIQLQHGQPELLTETPAQRRLPRAGRPVHDDAPPYRDFARHAQAEAGCVALRAFATIACTMRGVTSGGISWPICGMTSSSAPGIASAVAWPPLGVTR